MLRVSNELPQQVRSTCAVVAQHATAVTIDVDAIAGYAERLATDRPPLASLDSEHHYVGHGVDTVTFILTLEAVNFGSGYFPKLEKLDGLSGYFTVAHHLTAFFREHAPITAPQLAAITVDDCAAIFHQPTGTADRAELMQLFAASLNELGQFLIVHYGGSFPALVEDAGQNASRLVGFLAQMDHFRDVAEYRGEHVAFFKRAQIAVSDLNLAFAGRLWGAFVSLADLTVFADNVLPNVLRADGLLLYNADLGGRIDRGELIEAGGTDEVEIRACTVHVCEQITARIREHDPTFTARDLDYILWNRGQLPHYKGRPRHRCKTASY